MRLHTWLLRLQAVSRVGRKAAVVPAPLRLAAVAALPFAVYFIPSGWRGGDLYLVALAAGLVLAGPLGAVVVLAESFGLQLVDLHRVAAGAGPEAVRDLELAVSVTAIGGYLVFLERWHREAKADAARLRAAVEAVEGALWERDLQAGTIDVVAVGEGMRGAVAAGALPGSEEALERLADRDYAAWDARYTDEVRGARRVGHRATVIRGADGRPVALRGITLDVTEQRRGSAMYRALFESDALGVAVFDVERRVLACNRRSAEMLGYDDPRELEGVSIRDLHYPGDDDVSGASFNALVAGGIDRYQVELRYRRKDGSPIWLRVSAARSVEDVLFAFIEDIDEAKLAEAELHDKTALLERAHTVGGVGTWVWDARTNRTVWSSDAARIFGFTEEEAAEGRPESYWSHVHPDDLELAVEADARWLAGGAAEVEHRVIDPDGNVRWIRSRGDVERDADGTPLRQFGVVIDITDTKLARDELRDTAALLDRAQQIGGVGTWVWDAATNRTHWSAEARRIYGFTDEEAETGDPTLFHAIVHPDDRDVVELVDVDVVANAHAMATEHRIIWPDGEVRWVRSRSDVELAPDGSAVRQLGVVIDITESKRAEEELREMSALFERAEQVGGVGGWVWYPYENRHVWSPQARRIMGFTDEEAETEDPALAFDAMHPDDRADIAERVWRKFEQGEAEEVEYRIIRRSDGEIRWVREYGVVDLGPDGRPWRVFGAITDRTELVRAEADLRESEAQLVRAQELGRVGAWAWYPYENRNIWSAEARRIYGLTDEQADTQDPDLYFNILHPDERDEIIRQTWEAFNSATTSAIEYRIVRPDGEIRWVRGQGDVELDEHGKPFRMAGVVMDITDSKLAAEQQRHLTEQLRQAQKLEAVGQLAGGVAHDFNNLLTVILGHAGLALSGNPGDAAGDLEEIMRAGERATELVRQLLTFSRKQAVGATLVDVNEIVMGSWRMLRRLIETTVEIEDDLSPEPLPVLADRGQLEQVLVNLAVNARDAMPDGGRLTIRTRAVHDGSVPVVRLTVEDTGEGMDATTLQRVFEPFFTTKEPGRGTGLGLSTVYGIVRGVGGDVELTSEPGVGTACIVTLPLAAVEGAGGDASPASAPDAASGLGRSVLLVEDDDAVRDVGRQMLESSGYTVISASDGEEAIELVEGGAAFDFLITDLVMPKLNGTELAIKLRELRPGLPVLYASGYTRGALGDAAAEPNSGYLPKPFTRAGLETAIRALLAG